MNVEQGKMFKRVGIHYYPDTTHFRNIDLQKWIPELKSLGLSWLVLQSPIERAIPESFISQVIKNNITPIIHFNQKFQANFAPNSFDLLLESYSNWGVKYICIYDRPNMKSSWATNFWIENDLVESFLDKFIPLAKKIISYDMVPIYPPLEPGGDYWDTTFLRNSIKSIERRGSPDLLDSMAIGAYGWINQKSLSWGAGGAECWPESIPYFTPPGQQDHIGFHIFDWYTEIIKAELGKTLPIIILKISEKINNADSLQYSARKAINQSKLYLNIIEKLQNSEINPKSEPDIPNHTYFEDSIYKIENVPNNVLSANFWVLITSSESKYSHQAWYKPNRTHLPIVNYLKNINQNHSHNTNKFNPKSKKGDELTKENSPVGSLVHQSIKHYLLIPRNLNGSDGWQNIVIRNFIEQHHPTIGYSIREACLASKVTIFGEVEKYNVNTIKLLQKQGRKIEVLNWNGTILALQ